MRRGAALAAALLVAGLPSAGATAAPARPGRVVFTDPSGDANFSGAHGGAVPAGSQPEFDLVWLGLETTHRIVVKQRRVTKVPDALRMTMQLAGAPSTLPSASFGLVAAHSKCGQLRIQVYVTPDGPTGYADLADCGTVDPAATNPDHFVYRFQPAISGRRIVAELPLAKLPKQVAAGTTVNSIRAYTTNAEFLVAGYQATDVTTQAGIDDAVTKSVWIIG